MKLRPCPKCGETPVVDRGFSDAPWPPGEEFIQCPAVFELEGRGTVTCGTSSIGAEHWNFRRGDE